MSGGYWSSAGAGGMMGALGSLAGSAISAGVAVAEGKKARDFQKKVMKRRYQWMAGDLEKAGINRILAPSIGAGGASSPVANVPDFGASLSRGAEAGAKMRKTDAEKELIGKQLDVAGATHARLLEDTAGLRAKRLAFQRDPRNLLFDSEGFGHMLDWPKSVAERAQSAAGEDGNFLTRQIRKALGMVSGNRAGSNNQSQPPPYLPNAPGLTSSNW